MYISGKNDVLHKPSEHRYSGFGSMKLSLTDHFFVLVFITMIQVILCTVMLRNSTNFPELKWIQLQYQIGSIILLNLRQRVANLWSFQKKSSCLKILKNKKYINSVSYFDHKRFVFTDKKPMKRVDFNNKKIWQSPLNGYIHFVDTGFNICNVHNLMAAIKLKT